MEVDAPSGTTTDTRDGRKKIAESTLKLIEQGYVNTLVVAHSPRYVELAAKIRYSNLHTCYYPPDDHFASRWPSYAPFPVSPKSKTDISMVELSAIDAARSLRDSLSSLDLTSFGRIALLSFASPTRPGGRFLDGGDGQEESVARSSTLYYSLMTETAQQFYELHRRDRNGGFHHHAMIYNPSVVIFRQHSGERVSPYEVDVLSCAAVDAGDVRKNGGRADQAEVERVVEYTMKERMARILSVMEQQGAKYLVLGGFGTGACRNSVEMVARIWADLLARKGARFGYSFHLVTFANLGTAFTAFKQAFENETLDTSEKDMDESDSS